MTNRLAVAASAKYPELRPDWPLLQAALARRGISATTMVWTDPDADWDELDLVVANGAWDNIHRPAEFLDWAEQVAALTQVVNSPTTLRWNMDKRYLATLDAAGVPIVPTTFIEPTDDPDHAELPDTEFVVKPNISGGGFQTARYSPTRGDHAAARTHLTQLLAAGRTAMVQPYQHAIDSEQAETGLIFLAGEYSHAIRKGPLLPAGTRPGDSLHSEDGIGPTRATAVQIEMAAHALGAAEALLGPTTYARVDLVPDEDGAPLLIELELLDPALFFDHHLPGADRFADVLAQTFG